MRRLLFTGMLLASPSQAHAQSELEKGFLGALVGCEEWILDPATWVDGPSPYLAKIGLGPNAGFVSQVSEQNLPPPEFRRANHYLRINSTPTAGFVLVVSDQVPMCHITGGGQTDLEPVVKTVLESPDFAKRWENMSDKTHDDIVTSEFRNRRSHSLSILISRASASGGRVDRVQLIATAQYALKK